MQEKRIEHYLEEGESILWHGKAKENDYLYCKMINIFPLYFLWLAAECVILGFSIYANIFDEDFSVYYLILSIAAIVLHLVPTVIWFLAVMRENIRIKNEEYAVTDRRIIIMHSNAHHSVEIIDLKDVEDINIRRSLAEMFLGSGRVEFKTEDETIYFNSLEDAEKTFKKIYRAAKGKTEAKGE